MKAMILSAGMGERLRPLTLELPKAMMPVANRPLIEYSLHLLKRHGIKEIAINLHHMGARIKEHLRDGAALGVEIRYSEEPALLGTGGAIKKMRDFLGTGTFLVINADILIDIDLRKVIAFHRSREALSTMVLRPNPDPVRYGTIETDASGRIREFMGKTRTEQTGLKRWMFTGIHVMEPEVMESMPSRDAFCINRDVYAHWIRSERPCYGYVHEGYWRDLGTLADYLQANMDLVKEKGAGNLFAATGISRPEAGEGAAFIGPNSVGSKVVIKEGAQIGPNTVIGGGSVVGRDARVSESLLWPGSVIEDREHVRGMIVTPYQRVQAIKSPDPSPALNARTAK